MRHFGLAAIIVALSFIASSIRAEDKPAAPAAPAAPAESELPKPDADGWINLFNGKDLSGWHGDPEIWRVVDGYISGKKEKQGWNSFLIFNKQLSNYQLEAKFILVDLKKGNSGFQVRSKVKDWKKFVVNGYQPDIGDGWHGTLYEEGGRGVLVKAPAEVSKAVKQEDWNQYKITLDGPKIKGEINGVVGFEYEEKDEKKGAKEGILALQYHAPGNFEIRFKDIRIKLIEAK